LAVLVIRRCHVVLQRRRGLKKVGRQEVQFFDIHCKFPTEKTVCARNFNFVPKFFQGGFLATNVTFLQKFSDKKRILPTISRCAKFMGGRSNWPLVSLMPRRY